MNSNRKILAWVPFVIALAIVGGMFLGKLVNPPRELTVKQEKLVGLMDIIGKEYVDELDTDSLLETVFPYLVGSLDPHSSYIPANAVEQFNEGMQGSFSGIGVSFNMFNDSVNVMEVIVGGPSERAGLMAGDKIVTVDGESVSGVGLSADEIRSRLKGEKGTKVTLGIDRATSKKIIELEVERGDIPVNSVDAFYMIDPGIGYVNVSQFTRTTYDEYINALGQLNARGAEAFIIDLRGNPGGYLEMAIMMANEFLPQGAPIVSTRYRNSEMDQVIVADGHGSFPNTPVVVLIDEYSASSSEVFSGAIQDNDRGLVIGRRSFGKGLIQKQFDLPDSSSILITVGRYYTPSGRSIQKDYSNKEEYQYDIVRRFNHGEAFSADSIHQDSTLVYRTRYGRKVFGGGGIMPDIFVPLDTTGITGYYHNIVNAGLLQKFAFEYATNHREELSKAKTTKELLAKLPHDDVLLRQFINYASSNGIPARWYYINISHDLIVNQLKALIAYDILGLKGRYEVLNSQDNAVKNAVEKLLSGEANSPILPLTD